MIYEAFLLLLTWRNVLAENCIFTVGETTWDLSPLRLTSNDSMDYYTVNKSMTGQQEQISQNTTFYFNVCGDILSIPDECSVPNNLNEVCVQSYWDYYCNETVNRTSDTLTHGFGVYYDDFVDGDCKAIAGGDSEDYLPKPVTNQYFVDSSGNLVTYSYFGGPCLDGLVNSELRIEWICNNDTDFKVTAIQGGTAIIQCVVKLQIESQYACPISNGLDSFAPTTMPTNEPTAHPIVPQPLTDYDCNGFYNYRDNVDDDWLPHSNGFTLDVQAFDVCMPKNLANIAGEGTSISIGWMYQCYEDNVWVSTWSSLEEGYINDCSGTPDWGPQIQDSLLVGVVNHCSGIWNCPYAMVREYPFYGNPNHGQCDSNHSSWSDVPYIIERCTMINNQSHESSMLQCDDSPNGDGLVLLTYNTLNCTGEVIRNETYLEPDSCHEFDGDNLNDVEYRKLIECVDRSDETQPEFNTAAPTSAPTGHGKHNNEEEIWMIVGIAAICVIVVIAVVGGVLMCCGQCCCQKQNYSMVDQ